MTREQRDEQVIWEISPGIRIVKARSKYDRRRKMLVAQDGDQILREYFLDQEDAAMNFLDGYNMAKFVWRGMPREA